MSRLEIARPSWGEEVSSPRVGLSDRSRSLPSPSPLYDFQYRVLCVAFAFENGLQFGSGTRPLVMDTLAEIPEGAMHSCLPQLARLRADSHPCVHEKNTPLNF